MIDIKTVKQVLKIEPNEKDDGDSPRVTMTAFYLIGVAGISAVLLLILVNMYTFSLRV